MLAKSIVLAAIFVSTATAGTIIDENDMIDYVMDSYQTVLANATSSLAIQTYILYLIDIYTIFSYAAPGLGCCPIIVRGPKGSIIQPFTGWRGNVALIVDWGTCTVNDHGFKSVAILVLSYSEFVILQVLRELGRWVPN